MNILSRIASLFTRRITPSTYFANASNWTGVTSSNVHSIAYYIDIDSTRENILGVRFHSKDDPDTANSEYWYYGVPTSIWLNMIAAGSKGKFVWSDLRDRYRYEAKWKRKK